MAVLAAGGLNWNAYVHRKGLINDFEIAESMKHIGRELDARLGAGAAPPSTGILMAVCFALASRGPLFDLLGLNDVGMAHAARRRMGHPGHSALQAEVFSGRRC